MKIDAVIFDLAGTTIIDNGTVMRAFEGAIADEKISYRREYLIETMGQSKTQVLAEVARQGGLAGEAVNGFVERVHHRFEDIYIGMCRAGEITPIKGAMEAFGKLKSWGLQLATTTGFHGRVAQEVMRILDPQRTIFAAAISSDQVGKGRPAPDMILTACVKMGIANLKAVANVGDTRADLESAQRAGVGINIGVLTGEASRATLEKCPHTHLLESVSEVPGIIERILTE